MVTLPHRLVEGVVAVEAASRSTLAAVHEVHDGGTTMPSAVNMMSRQGILLLPCDERKDGVQEAWGSDDDRGGVGTLDRVAEWIGLRLTSKFSPCFSSRSQSPSIFTTSIVNPIAFMSSAILRRMLQN